MTTLLLILANRSQSTAVIYGFTCVLTLRPRWVHLSAISPPFSPRLPIQRKHEGFFFEWRELRSCSDPAPKSSQSVSRPNWIVPRPPIGILWVRTLAHDYKLSDVFSVASLDEHAFRQRVPEIGPAPDMIEDDLPSNLDYLDESFSASAGLKALEDDEEDEFYPDGPTSFTDQIGVVATYGGETIRILDPEGLQVIEHYFETLPPDSADESSLWVLYTSGCT